MFFHIILLLVILTPPNIVILKEEGSTITIEPSGTIARVSSAKEIVNTIEGVVFYKGTFGEIQDLPEPEEDTIFIVSGFLLSALNNTRDDVYAPAELIRDETGKPIGTKGLIQ